MIGSEAESVLNRAVKQAFERGHEYFTLEHVLHALLDEAIIREIMNALGANVSDIKKSLDEYLEKEVPRLKKEDHASPEEKAIIEHPVATLSIQRLIQRALFHVQSAGKEEITPEDLLVAMFQSKDSFSLHVLEKNGIKRLDVLNYISHGIEPSEDIEKDDKKNEKSTPAPTRADALELYTLNLNQAAKKGKIDPLIGRKTEIERVVLTLCRRRKNNPLLVGEAGVGKTAIAEGLALKVVQGDVPDVLKRAEFYSLDLGALLAGAKFRGDFEQRLKKVLKSLAQKKAQGVLPVLVVDEIHTIIGAGAVGGGVLDAANLLKPDLTRGEFQVIGSTTYKEYRNIFEKDAALARRFQKIDVPEPTQEDAIRILEGIKPVMEAHHSVRFTDQAIRSAVELSIKHLTDRFLPDKAIDVLDETGAKSRVEKLLPGVWLTEKDVEETIAKIARIPTRSVSSNQKHRLKNLGRDLKLSIFGQDSSIDQVVTAIQLSRSGLRTGEKPVGSFLLCGPTGVGKTEFSKQLAHCLGVPFLRFDMSEYIEKHTVSRLIGAPPGYVGFDQSGLLTDALLKNPHAVLLLDEFEKAHSDVWNLLLQIMDHGFLTDNNGRKADFRNAVILMTTNVGSFEMSKRAIGVMNSDVKHTSRKEVERTFSPEFRNRLDGILYFDALSPQTVQLVVVKQLIELESQLLARQIEIEIDAGVRELLAKEGYDKEMGARPLGRVIQEKIKKPLSEEILFGKLEHGGKVRVILKDEKISFEIAPKLYNSERMAATLPQPP